MHTICQVSLEINNTTLYFWRFSFFSFFLFPSAKCFHCWLARWKPFTVFIYFEIRPPDYIYIYIYVCVRVCVCVQKGRSNICKIHAEGRTIKEHYFCCNTLAVLKKEEKLIPIVAYIYILDTYRRMINDRRTNKGRMIKTQEEREQEG